MPLGVAAKMATVVTAFSRVMVFGDRLRAAALLGTSKVKRGLRVLGSMGDGPALGPLRAL